MMKRRDFLFRSATLALGTSLVPQFASLANATAKGPKLGLTTYMIGSQWTLPQLIDNLTRLEIFGLELRTDAKFAHGLELDSDMAKRNEVKKRMEDSPVKLISIADGERFDSPDSEVQEKSIERTRKLLQLCADVGAPGLRVFPNDFPKDVPHEKTLDQIAASLQTLAPTAESLNVEIRLEAHGSVGRLPTLELIAKKVNHPKVRIMLNSDFRDTEGDGLLANLKRVGPYLGGGLHLHDLTAQKNAEATFYETQLAFLKSIGWNGWCLLEINDKPDDDARLAEIATQKKRWDELMKDM